MEASSILTLVKQPVSDKIKEMRKDSEELSMLYFGDDTDTFLQLINGYENSTQHALRKKLAISMEFMVEELLRQVDSIWSAKGGSIEYGIKGENLKKFKETLNDVRGGMSLRKFVKEIWFERFVVDPNGLTFLDIDEDGEKFKLTYKSIHSIQSYEVSGIDVEWVLFEPFKIEEKTNETEGVTYQWFVDSEKYVLLKITNGIASIEDAKPHIFGQVPCIVNSSIFSTKKAIKISPIKRQTDLLKSYLIKNSVKEIYQYLHLYPIYWQYEQICPVCKGKRKIGTEVCGPCNGTGMTTRKDVSDVISLKKPEQGETPVSAPAGFIQPEIATLVEQRNELVWLWNLIFHSHWGTTTEKSTNDTATGRFIDIQPVNNRLNIYADIAQTVETKLMNLIGKWQFPESYKESISLIGRRFIIETPDMLMTRYLDAKIKFAPINMLDWLLEQFYIAEFANDEKMADFYLTLMNVEPYIHLSIDNVQVLQIDPKIIKRKLYFQEWLKTINPATVTIKKPEGLIAELDKFILNQKDPENGTGKTP